MENQENILSGFSKEEEAYRRGYSQGFLAARNSNASFESVQKWRYGDEETAPPGSCMEGMPMHGLKEIDKHRFFINKLEN